MSWTLLYDISSITNVLDDFVERRPRFFVIFRFLVRRLFPASIVVVAVVDVVVVVFVFPVIEDVFGVFFVVRFLHSFHFIPVRVECLSAL